MEYVVLPFTFCVVICIGVVGFIYTVILLINPCFCVVVQCEDVKKLCNPKFHVLLFTSRDRESSTLSVQACPKFRDGYHDLVRRGNFVQTTVHCRFYRTY